MSIVEKCIKTFNNKYPNRKIYSIGSLEKYLILATYTDSGSSDDGFYIYDPLKDTVKEYPWLLNTKELAKAMDNIVYKENEV